MSVGSDMTQRRSMISDSTYSHQGFKFPPSDQTITPDCHGNKETLSRNRFISADIQVRNISES